MGVFSKWFIVNNLFQTFASTASMNLCSPKPMLRDQVRYVNVSENRKIIFHLTSFCFSYQKNRKTNKTPKSYHCFKEWMFPCRSLTSKAQNASIWSQLRPQSFLNSFLGKYKKEATPWCETTARVSCWGRSQSMLLKSCLEVTLVWSGVWDNKALEWVPREAE